MCFKVTHNDGVTLGRLPRLLISKVELTMVFNEGSLCRLDKLIYIKCLEEGVANDTHSINIRYFCTPALSICPFEPENVLCSNRVVHVY